MSSRRADILIVGAGPAGAAAAIEAARAGANVHVFDRARFPRPKTCGDAVSNRGGHLVDELVGHKHALAEIPHARVRVSAAWLPNGEVIERAYRDDPGWIVPRFHLDDLLRRAVERSDAVLHQGAAVRRLVLEAGVVRGLELDDGTVWRSRVVVAADGPGSVGWRALGRSYQRGRRLAVAITGYYEGIDFSGRDDVSEHYFARELPAGYGWIFPSVDGASNVGVYQRADRFDTAKAKLPALLDEFIRRHPQRFGHARCTAPLRTWALPLGVAPLPPGGPGLLLAGDAAHCVDPLSGEGIWQALHTGRAAGQVAVRAVVRGELTPRLRAAYFADYTRHIALPSAAKLAIQDGLDVALARGLDEHPAFVRALHRGYNNPWLEASKLLH